VLFRSLIFITPHILKAQAAAQMVPAAAPAPAVPGEAPKPQQKEPPGTKPGR
jgi:hypothetical protein